MLQKNFRKAQEQYERAQEAYNFSANMGFLPAASRWAWIEAEKKQPKSALSYIENFSTRIGKLANTNNWKQDYFEMKVFLLIETDQIKEAEEILEFNILRPRKNQAEKSKIWFLSGKQSYSSIHACLTLEIKEKQSREKSENEINSKSLKSQELKENCMGSLNKKHPMHRHFGDKYDDA